MNISESLVILHSNLLAKVPSFALKAQTVFKIMDWKWWDSDLPPKIERIENSLYELIGLAFKDLEKREYCFSCVYSGRLQVLIYKRGKYLNGILELIAEDQSITEIIND